MAKLTPAQMIAPKAIAPCEAAHAFKLWHERMMADAADQGDTLDESSEGHIIDQHSAGGLGPPWPLQQERPLEYGERVAAALFTLIMEI